MQYMMMSADRRGQGKQGELFLEQGEKELMQRQPKGLKSLNLFMELKVKIESKQLAAVLQDVLV